MIKLYKAGVYLVNGKELIEDSDSALNVINGLKGMKITKEKAKKGTIAYSIIQEHNISVHEDALELKFDSLTSHDITYVGIIQTARASGMKKFPMPYVLTNCHNTLCAVGGTINEDDHKFALSAAEKYGGIYVPPHMAVIHSYNREMMAACGKMILGSDSHTRYGALGTMAVGEGGGELVKQLVGRTYDVQRPETVAIYLTGEVMPGVGPHDVALQIIGKVYSTGYVKNKVMEFVGEGVSGLDMEFRNGIDVMTTETTCWSSIWTTDEKVKKYFEIHGRPEAYKRLAPEAVAYYDGLVHVELDKIKPSIALPFHPSNVYTIEEFKENAEDILNSIEDEVRARWGECCSFDLLSKFRDGEFYVDQGVVAGCAGGTFDNIVAVSDILDGKSVGNGTFSLSVYPGSQPTYKALVDNGSISTLMDAGAVIRSAFCGPCFGAGDTPANSEFSIRHATRNFPSREGSKPGDKQISFVALMDARSIAATAMNGGKLTAADTIDVTYTSPEYSFSSTVYENRNFDGRTQLETTKELILGPSIKDWPQMKKLENHLLIEVVSFIEDAVTTTDELIPSGETSAYRSDPYKLAEFTLSRRDPEYVERAKEVQENEKTYSEGQECKVNKTLEKLIKAGYLKAGDKISYGSTIFAKKPGDGSAREHAASCQKVLGAWANIANEYATKRYRSNLINWGMVPFVIDGTPSFTSGSQIFIPNIKGAIQSGSNKVKAYVCDENMYEIELRIDSLTEDERNIITSGSLINFHKSLITE